TAISVEDIEAVSPLLIGSGAAALGAWRLRASGQSEVPAADSLRQSARILALEDMAHFRAVAHLSSLLGTIGVTALIFKGWAASKFYAEPWLRPYGDLDILVLPAEYQAATAALQVHAIARMSDSACGEFYIECGGSTKAYAVDLHAALPLAYASDLDDLFARATRAATPNAALLVPSPEDHLRIVIIHLLKHGAWRPLWLCDVAAMVEAASPDFDWDSCLTSDHRIADWIVAVVALASRLLECRINHLPVLIQNFEVPKWIELCVLKEWEAPYAARFRVRRLAAVRDPAAWLRARWPNPIMASFEQGGKVGDGPKLAYQLANFLVHVRKGLVNLSTPVWWRKC
ncbi:MAG: nucleotidyltransferase family protein, partial [Sphingomonas sp.]